VSLKDNLSQEQFYCYDRMLILRGPNTGGESLRGYLATGLLNHVGDVNLGIHDFTECPTMVTL
jgi:hypothetical protein